MNHKPRLVAIAVATLMLVAAAVDTAQAQRRGGRLFFARIFGDNGSVAVGLLKIEEIQQELKLSDSQIEKVTKIADDLRAEQRKLREGITRENWREKSEERRKESAKLAGPAVKETLDSLEDPQKKRWLELLIQARGAAVLPGVYVAQLLELSEEQTKKLEDLTTKQRAELFAMFGDSEGLSREERREKINGLVKETNKKRRAVLTKEQRTELRDLRGEKFEFPED